MPNSKTAPKPSKPENHNGWIRKSELDAWLDRYLPIPTQVITNEEYTPIPQTPEQRRLEREILAGADLQARHLSMDRRKFLKTSCGMALAFAAMNTVFGRMFTVEAEELFEPAAVEENKLKTFIFDIQTHHVAMPEQSPHADQDFLRGVVGMRNRASKMNPALKDRKAAIEDAYLENYIKEVFLDSDTDVVALSALPGSSEETDVLTPEVIFKSKSWINELTSSPRVISHGYFSPDVGQENLDLMDAQLSKLKINAWKGYTGVARAKGKEGWRVDDEKTAYPALERAQKQGVKNICLHKGLPFPGDPEWWNPMDVTKAAKDFPNLNFLVYHSGFKGVGALSAATGIEVFKNVLSASFRETTYIPWTSDICAWKKKNPEVKNIYMEMGSTFAMMVSTNPLLAAYVIGMIIDAFGAEHLLWGTDSIWWGSPQWQIEAFRRLEMPEDFQKRFGYKPLTADMKRIIFGLNAAQVYGIDPKEKINLMPADYLHRLRKMYKASDMAEPSNTQYGWLRADSVVRS